MYVQESDHLMESLKNTSTRARQNGKEESWELLLV